jgi:hypothetical protein
MKMFRSTQKGHKMELLMFLKGHRLLAKNVGFTFALLSTPELVAGADVRLVVEMKCRRN